MKPYFRRSLHIRIENYDTVSGPLKYDYRSLNKNNRDIEKLRNALENEIGFNQCETLTQNTYLGASSETSLFEGIKMKLAGIREESTSLSYKTRSALIQVNLIQVQGHGCMYYRD